MIIINTFDLPEVATTYITIPWLPEYIYYVLGEELPPQEMQVIEKGTQSRGNVYFSYPKEVDENGFYILNGKESVMDELEAAGFTMKKEGFYTVCYKE